MKPIRIICIAAGVTLVFAIVSLLMNGWSVYMLQHMIATMKQTGDDVETMRSYQRSALTSAAWCFVILLCQVAIIFYARRIDTKSHSA
jgi:glucan phosphoethanolaminetransferase (alkaline phosphatase superfamily)